MESLLLYLVKSAVLMAVFFLGYRLLLSHETFHRFNRVILITIALLSFVLPFFHITRYVDKPLPVNAADVANPEHSIANVLLIALIVVYWSGVAFVIVKKAISVMAMARIIKNGRYTDRSDGCDVIESDQIPQPLNWMRFIVMPREWLEKENASVWRHETLHASRWHSLDLLMTDVMTALQWFNPVMILLRREFELIHEYEADRAVIDSGADAREYKLMLVNAVASSRGLSMTSWLKNSNLKKRIDMMYRQPSAPWKRLKSLYIPLVAIVFLYLTADVAYGSKDSAPAPWRLEKHVVWIFSNGNAKVKLDDLEPVDMPLDQVPGYLKKHKDAGISRITLRYMYDIQGLDEVQPFAEKVCAQGIRISVANNDEMLDQILMPEYRCARIYDEGGGQYRFELNCRSAEENRKIRESGSYTYTDTNGLVVTVTHGREKYESPIKNLSITGDINLMKHWIGMFDGHGVGIYPVDMPYTDAEEMARAAWKRGINQVSLVSARPRFIVLIPQGSEWSKLYPGEKAADVIGLRNTAVGWGYNGKGKTIANPKIFYNSNTQDFNLTYIVRMPQETVIVYEAYQRPDLWITGFNSMELIAGDKRYKQIGYEGLVGFEKMYFWSPDEGRYVQSMHFEPISDDVNVVDLYNNDVNATIIKGIQVSDDLTYFDNIRTISALSGDYLKTTHINEEQKDLVKIERIDMSDNETTIYLSMVIREPHSFMGHVGSDFELKLHDGTVVKPIRFEGVPVDEDFYRNGDHVDTPFQLIFPPLPKNAFNFDDVMLSGSVCHEPLKFRLQNQEIIGLRNTLPEILKMDQYDVVNHFSHYHNLKALLNNLYDSNVFGGNPPAVADLEQRDDLLRKLGIDKQDLDKFIKAEAYIMIYKKDRIYIADPDNSRTSISVSSGRFGNSTTPDDPYEYLKQTRYATVDDDGNWYAYGKKAVIWEI